MGNGQDLIAVLLADFQKPVISEIAGGHLDADRIPLRISISIEISPVKPDAAGLRPFPDQSLIPVTFLTTKMKIAMRHGKVITASVCELRHAHRVNASANGKEDCLSLRNQSPCNPFKRFFHYFFREAIVYENPKASDSLN